MMAEKPDYKQVAVDFAKDAIRAAILINGGAAVALLSQVGTLIQNGQLKVVSAPMSLWAIGVVFGVFSWGLAFKSARHYDRHLSGHGTGESEVKISDRYMWIGVFSFALSVASFAGGCLVLACKLAI